MDALDLTISTLRPEDAIKHQGQDEEYSGCAGPHDGISEDLCVIACTVAR